MYLNSISPNSNSKKKRKRVGRGIGSTLGKTCGRGHKGQHARSGGYHKTGFEGGQMPLQRRLPKVGFKSKNKISTVVLTLSQLNEIDDQNIDLKLLVDKKIVNRKIKKVKIIGTGEISKSKILKGINITEGAKLKIENSGGRIEE